MSKKGQAYCMKHCHQSPTCHEYEGTIQGPYDQWLSICIVSCKLPVVAQTLTLLSITPFTDTNSRNSLMMYETLSISPAHLLCALLNIFLRKQDDRDVLVLVGSKSSCAACRSLQMMPTGFPFTRSRNVMPNSKLLKTRRCVQGKGCRGGVTTQHLEYTHAQDLSITRTLHFPGEYTLLKFTFTKIPPPSGPHI